jgi:DNA-binding MarR family transcriptional regulator
MGSHADRRPVPDAPHAARALDAIRRIVRALRVSSSALQRELGVSGAQLYVLQQLAEAPAESIADLARRTVTDQSSVSVVVSRLVERKLVTRVPSKLDARRAEIALTPKGRALLGRGPRPAQERLIESVKCLEPNELEALTHALERVVTTMGAAEESPAMFFEESADEAEGKNIRGEPRTNE